MIVIHHFKEAVQLCKSGQIPYRLLQEQAMVLNDMNADGDVPETFNIGEDAIEALLQQDEAEEDYNGMLGGDVHVCETEADLKQILGLDMDFAKSHGDRWPDVTDLVMSWDRCDFLEEKDSEPEWAVFLLCWNDAGGSVFYVPKHLWAAAKVSEHVEETNGFWDQRASPKKS